MSLAQVTNEAEFGAFVASLGLVPKRPPQADGRWRRCGTQRKPRGDSGAYKLLPSGTLGWAWDLSAHEHPVRWRADGGTGPLEPIDLEALRAAEAEHRRMSDRARLEAAAFWEACEWYQHPHPYIERKGLDAVGCSGLKIDKDGWLVAPAYGPRGKAGGLRTVQRISPEGDKRFWPGAPVGGTAFRIRHYNRKCSVTVLCEGLATGLAIYQAVPIAGVIVCWDAGNLARTAHYVRGKVCVAADNDHGTEREIGRNPGLEAARQASERIGCGIAVPEGIEGTDWCDYRQEKNAARMARRYRGLPTEGEIRKTVDGEIRAAILRASQYITPTR